MSTDGQSLSAQIAQLKAAECDKIFREKISGARADRNQLKRLLEIVERDDLVIVTRLDRLARSTVLGGLVEFERELIRVRTGEGRARAKARGVRRKPKLTSHQKQEALARRDAGEALADIGRSFNVSHSTISRLR